MYKVRLNNSDPFKSHTQWRKDKKNRLSDIHPLRVPYQFQGRRSTKNEVQINKVTNLIFLCENTTEPFTSCKYQLHTSTRS